MLFALRGRSCRFVSKLNRSCSRLCLVPAVDFVERYARGMIFVPILLFYLTELCVTVFRKGRILLDISDL